MKNSVKTDSSESSKASKLLMITEKWKTLTSVTQRSWSDQILVRRTKVIEDFFQRIREHNTV